MSEDRVSQSLAGVALPIVVIGCFGFFLIDLSLGAERRDQASEAFLVEPTPSPPSLYQPRSLAPPRRKLQADVRAFNGDSAVGRLVDLDRQGVVVAVAASAIATRVEPRRFDADSLPLVRFCDGAARRNQEAPRDSIEGRVWFRGGSTLPIKNLRTLEDGLSVEILADGEAWPRPLVVSIDQLQSVRFPIPSIGREADSPSSECDRQWREIQARDSAADAVVTPPRGAGGLDYVEGFVEAIGADSVRLFLDDQPVDAPRARVYGVVFASDPLGATPVDEEGPRFGPLVSTLDGFELHARDFRIVDGRALFIQTLDGFEITLPLGRVARIDYRNGRVLELGDLNPSRVAYAPLFGTPRGLSEGLIEVDQAFRVDRSYWGQRLTLRDPTELTTGRRQYDRGLALRSGAEVVYRVPPGVRRFDAVVGIDPDAAGRRGLRLVIEDAAGDAGPLYRGTLTANDPPRAIGAPLVGVAALRLRVERVFGADGTLHLGSARLIR